MFRKTVSGIMLMLLLTGTVSMAFIIVPAVAERVIGGYVWAEDRTGDGWITAGSSDQIGVVWDNGPDQGVYDKYIEVYADGVLTYSINGGKYVGGITWVDTSLFGTDNEIHVWYLDKAEGYTLFKFTLPKLAAEFPIYPFYETIYIRADGSIDPPIAPISTVDNITYTFTDNITDAIAVERDNIVVDGAGYTVQGVPSGAGISLSGRQNVTIKNMNIEDFYYGIMLSSSCEYNSISENNITNNYSGIELSSSCEYNSISENNITGGTYNGIFLDSSSNNSIIRNNFANNSFGIEIGFSSNNSISENELADNSGGIYLFHSSNNSVSWNNMTANDAGIFLSYSSNNNVYHNNFLGNIIWQVYIQGSSANVLDDGYPSGGNYWSDYSGTDFYTGQYQNETGSDGIGDTPYVIDANNTDYYPLMSPYVTPNIHDVAVTGVAPFKTVIEQGLSMGINVTVMNRGNCDETFNVTVSANATLFASQNVTLTSGNSTTITLTWSTTGFAYGNYTISANAASVLGEINTGDNLLVDGTVKITVPGDINGDGIVDIYDAIILAGAYNSHAGSPNWNPNADINGDGWVDIYDAIILAGHYNQHYP